MRQKKNGLENLVLITQLGLNVVTPVLICVLFGSWIDKKTGLHTVLIFLIQIGRASCRERVYLCV